MDIPDSQNFQEALIIARYVLLLFKRDGTIHHSSAYNKLIECIVGAEIDLVQNQAPPIEMLSRCCDLVKSIDGNQWHLYLLLRMIDYIKCEIPPLVDTPQNQDVFQPTCPNCNVIVPLRSNDLRRKVRIYHCAECGYKKKYYGLSMPI